MGWQCKQHAKKQGYQGRKLYDRKEAAELKHKDFIIALYLTDIHSNKAEGQAHLLNNSFALENSASMECTCMQCHAHSVSKDVFLQSAMPYMLAMQKHNKQADSVSGTQRSKVTEVESSMIEKKQQN